MITALSKGPKLVSSRSQGLLTLSRCLLPRDAVAPHFWGWCLEEFSSLARWFGGGAALLPLCPHCLPWWLLPRSALLSRVFLRKSTVLVRGWGTLRRHSKARLGTDSPGRSAEEATDVMTPLKQECANQEARPASHCTQRPAVCREVWGELFARVCRGGSIGSP